MIIDRAARRRSLLRSRDRFAAGERKDREGDVDPTSEAMVRLVRAARGGDRSAFGLLWEEWAPTIHGVLLAMLPPGEVADVLSEVSLLALRRLAQLDDEKAFGGWLCAIARNKGKDQLRRRRPTGELPVDWPAAPARDSAGGETAAQVLGLIRRLPPAYAETLVLRLVEGLTGPEIAERTGMTPGSVRVNLCRGFKLLREKLETGERP